MTDIWQPHNDITIIKNDALSMGNKASSMLLQNKICAKQKKVYDLREQWVLIRDFVRRIGCIVSLFSGLDDEKYRENQLYNVLNCYVCGDINTAHAYQSEVLHSPIGFWKKLFYRRRLKKARKNLRGLLMFIDRTGCRQKFKSGVNNDDFCMAIKLVLNVRQSDKNPEDFLKRRMDYEYKYLNNLKLLNLEDNRICSSQEMSKLKYIQDWISKEQAIDDSVSGYGNQLSVYLH